jgi:hypothetical protein
LAQDLIAGRTVTEERLRDAFTNAAREWTAHGMQVMP